MTAPRSGARRTLAELSAPSEPGNERQAMEEVAAVAEATMNAMEHGNYYRAEVPVTIEVSASDTDLSVKITDEGSGPPAFDSEIEDNPETILLNFEEVDYINSTGISLIVGVLARARASKRRLLAYGFSDHYLEIFNITRLSDFVGVFTGEEAVRAGAT